MLPRAGPVTHCNGNLNVLEKVSVIQGRILPCNSSFFGGRGVSGWESLGLSLSFRLLQVTFQKLNFQHSCARVSNPNIYIDRH